MLSSDQWNYHDSQAESSLGWAYTGREICVSKSIGLAFNWKEIKSVIKKKKKRLKACLQWKLHLACPANLQALHSNIQKQIIQIQHNRIKNPNWQKATSWLFTLKRGREIELGTTKHKSSKWPERDSNPEPPDCKSDALSTRPRCLPGETRLQDVDLSQDQSRLKNELRKHQSQFGTPNYSSLANAKIYELVSRFSLCFILNLRAISEYNLRGAGIWGADLSEDFLRYVFGGAHIWRCLFSEVYGNLQVDHARFCFCTGFPLFAVMSPGQSHSGLILVPLLLLSLVAVGKITTNHLCC